MYVVEYSKNQDCFHITTLDDSIKKNRKMFEENTPNDFQIIALVNSYEDAKATATFLRKKYKEII